MASSDIQRTDQSIDVAACSQFSVTHSAHGRPSLILEVPLTPRTETSLYKTGPPHPLRSPSISKKSISRDSAPSLTSPDLMQPEKLPLSWIVTSSGSDFRTALETVHETHPIDARKGSRRLSQRSSSARSPSLPAAVSFDASMRPPDRIEPQRAQTAPYVEDNQDAPKPTSPSKWGKIRALMPALASHRVDSAGPSVAVPHTVNMTDELMSGGLAMLLLRLWFERDEKGHRRVPILFHRLRIRISDSIYPLDRRKTVFRVECDYFNGALRWVIYRQLRDFISLHAHYKLSNAYNRNADALPEFPRTSIPHLKFLSREKGRQEAKAKFAKTQRAALEDYLINLTKAVMFHPSANRLAGFLEISALFISLARSGGCQYKAGFMRIKAPRNKDLFGRKSNSWKENKESRWCAVRDSYLVIMQESGEPIVWDVFLLDSSFKVERPRRYYRQHLHLGHHGGDSKGVPRGTGTICRMITNALHLHLPQDANANEGHGDEPPREPETAASISSCSSDDALATHVLDPSTNADFFSHGGEMSEKVTQTGAKQSNQKRMMNVSKHTFYIQNSQTRLKLTARNERQMLQWITALERAAAGTPFTGSNRFDSFAPIRLNVAVQWLVDGRDYFWNLSRAISLAKETIYIHDWWLSPELQLRRPNKPKYRLDNLLQRKAKEGVKIYVILYQEVSNRFTPTDSSYAKQRLLSLHPNIMVQRSPSHLQTGTFYWAHHEKLCVIDQDIAFMGGLDLCFGRWDTPQHVIVDDENDDCEASIWPGKDYSNPRVCDFHTLHKPEDDMYDRSKTPRMPWHDVGLQVVGQPARDLARHFVERWNYLLRIKNHSRVMPFLLPPPDFREQELFEMGLAGTCEMQICRSAGPWSLGMQTRIEHSIQNAYLKAIQLSKHFVYIENQFFITSTMVGEVKIENNIGDALVHRIIKAHRDGTPWKCCIVLPLLPGFPYPIDHGDASALRLILECQNRCISRGPNSIFARLRKEGIDPDDYIAFFSLRNWSKLPGDVLTTEQVYVHSKICIVDDRLAIIGSANINERSQRGDRDSELAAVIRDVDMIDSTMAGKPFKVGRFAHTLRVRLMREHLGVDVDDLLEEDLMATDHPAAERQQQPWDPDSEQRQGQGEGVTQKGKSSRIAAIEEMAEATKNAGIEVMTDASAVLATKVLHQSGAREDRVDALPGKDQLDEERTAFTREGEKAHGFAGSIVPTLEETALQEKRPPPSHTESGKADQDPRRKDGAGETPLLGAQQLPDGSVDSEAVPEVDQVEKGALFGAPANTSRNPKTGDELPQTGSGVNDAKDWEQVAPKTRSTLRKHLHTRTGSKGTLPTPTPKVDPQGFSDPISDEFWNNVWVASAVHNTEIYRKVFRAIPDDLITTWKHYRDFVLFHQRLNKPCKESPNINSVTHLAVDTWDQGARSLAGSMKDNTSNISVNPDNGSGHRSRGSADIMRPKPSMSGMEPFGKEEKEQMEELLRELRGHLVVYPTRFLEGEDAANNFLFNADRLLPLPIYN